MLKITPRQHIEAELAELRSSPQVQSVEALERGEALLTGYQDQLSTDELLFVLRLCSSGCQAAGRWLDGLQLCKRGLDTAARTHRNSEKIPFLAIAGNIHMFLGNYHLAIRSMREAITIAEHDHLTEDQAKLMQGLGPIYSRLELHDTALSMFETAHDLAGENALPTTRAAALNNIAREYRAMGKLDLAADKVALAMQALEAGGQSEWLPYLLHTRAEIAATRGAYADAMNDVEAATALLRERRNVPVLLRVLIDGADYLVKLGKFAAARDHLREAGELATGASLHHLREEAAIARVRLEHAEGNAPAALHAIEDFLLARGDARKIELAGQRVAAQFVEEVERTEARGRRESAAINELTLRLIETEAQAEKMAKQAARDPLTGVLNKAAFEAALARFVSGPQQPVALLILDIDEFRRVNEDLGQQAGDTVLAALVERLRQSLRTNDLLGRYGGDEFLLLCPGVGPRIANAIGNRILANVAREPIMHDGNEIAVTVSLGVACAQTKALTAFSYLVKRADAALRRAKLAGKNRAVIVRVNV